MTLLEIIGTLFALVGGWLTAKQNIWCWPIAIVAILIYIYIFYQSKLYGDSALQVVYIIASIYGWVQWKNGTLKNGTLDPALLKKTTFLFLLAATIIVSLLIGLLLDKTDSDVPFWDAFTTGFSLLATWMMAKKYIQNWILWIIIDTVYVGIYIYKELYVTGFQYFVFTILAVYGYVEWRNEIKKSKLVTSGS